MAIPAIPQNYWLQTADGQNFLSWDLVAGATSYNVHRSTDGVTFASLATPTTPYYLDDSVTVGTQYYYKVASVNSDGTSSYTIAQSAVPCLPGEMSLGQIRDLSKKKADLTRSNFVTLPEWNEFIRLSCYELYDLLVTTYQDYFIADPLTITMDGSTAYDLPNGQNHSAARALYKLVGVDMGPSSGNTTGWVTVNKFNFIDRNKYFFPNSNSILYGQVNMSYRVMGSTIRFIPNPSANQVVRLWYVPRLTQLLQDTDTTDMSISGWILYVIIRAAKYALDKEESDTSKLDAELLFLKQRIEASASNRDSGQPDTISDTRATNGSGWGGPGNGFQGGF